MWTYIAYFILEKRMIKFMEACSYVVYVLLSAASNFVSGALGRKQQEKLALSNQEVNQRLEENRQNFQIDMHLRNVDSQKNYQCLTMSYG